MLASDAVLRAYREAATKPIGAALTVNEAAEGLARLNDFMFSMFAEEIGEKLYDIQVPRNQRATAQSYNPINQQFPGNLDNFNQPGSPGFAAEPSVYALGPNSRIIYRGLAPTTVYLPEYPSDGCRAAFADTGSTAPLTINGNGRKIEGATTRVVASGAAPLEWFYRADLGNWIVIAALLATDQTPLPQEFDALLTSGTAIRLSALDQVEPTTGTKFIYDRTLRRCKHRYSQAGVTTGGGEYLASSIQAYAWGRPW